MSKKCPKCDGSGKVATAPAGEPSIPCDRCEGEGKLCNCGLSLRNCAIAVYDPKPMECRDDPSWFD